MRIGILSGGDGWHVRDLLRAAAESGCVVESLDFRRLGASCPLPPWVGNPSYPLPPCGGGLGWGVTGLSSLRATPHPNPPPQGGREKERQEERGQALDFDAVIVRTMPPGSLEQVVFRMDLLHRAQAAGVRILNSPAALEACVDKYLATARLAAAGLPVPPTVVCQHADAAMEAFHALGGDVVVKPLFGSEGRGMVRVSDPELAWRTFRTLERTQAVLYLQKFLPHPGWDLRVLLLGGRVLGAVRRHARNDWRTNVAVGGRAEAVTPTADEEQSALNAAAAVGAEFAGVDLLPADDGYVVLEVNAVPGWRALAPACGVDVAAAVVQHLEDGHG